MANPQEHEEHSLEMWRDVWETLEVACVVKGRRRLQMEREALDGCSGRQDGL